MQWPPWYAGYERYAAEKGIERAKEYGKRRESEKVKERGTRNEKRRMLVITLQWG
jgi:hypothetical protein